MTLTRSDMLTFLRRHSLAVQATVSRSGAPQAALVGFVATDDLELVFDTRGSSRKAANIRHDGRIALVVGWNEAQSVQIEGVADEPGGAELERLKRIYFGANPAAPELRGAKGMTYIRVRPTWMRYCDIRGPAPVIEELTLGAV